MSDWERKQKKFLEFLQTHGADEAPYRVDLDKLKIYWVDERELSLVVADCKVLLSYALSNNSIMMGWANISLQEGSAIDPVEGVDPIYSDCDPEQVWSLACFVADQAGAEAIYRTPSPQSWVMLGLWNLRPGGAEQFTSGSPKGHIVQVIESIQMVREISERKVLLDNYAESFLQMATHPYKATDYADPLKHSARVFRNMLVWDESEPQDQELEKLETYWDELD